MDMARNRVYQLWQRVHIGREQFLEASVLQNQIDNLVLARKRLQILLVGAELLGLGHLRFVGDTHLGKEHLTELTARVDIYLALARNLTNLSLDSRKFLRQHQRVVAQRIAIDSHTLPLHIGEYANHRLLYFVVEFRQRSLLLQHRTQHLVELQSNIGILRSVLSHTLHSHHIHSELLCALADKCFDRDWRVVQISLCQGIHSVTRLGIEQIVHKHCIPLCTLNLNAQSPQE